MKRYSDDLRGNRDIFLINIMQSPEFHAIRKKHLEHVFTGIDVLLRDVADWPDDPGHKQKIAACAREISEMFKISEKNATDLILTPNNSVSFKIRYSPKIDRDGDEIVIRIGQKTTKQDIEASWKYVKKLQKEMGGSGSKSSINPELAFCIHRQHVLKGRKIVDVFHDYSRRKLEGHESKEPTLSENDFRKYYKNIVEGL